MSNHKRRNELRKFSKAQMLEKVQRKPLGFFLVQDHGHVISCLRYFTEDEKQEIETMAATAQAACRENPKHTAKGGLCCLLMATNEEVWRQYH